MLGTHRDLRQGCTLTARCREEGLFVVPIVYVLMDRLCVKFTGHSSAHGLKTAQDIERETNKVPENAAAH